MPSRDHFIFFDMSKMCIGQRLLSDFMCISLKVDRKVKGLTREKKSSLINVKTYFLETMLKVGQCGKWNIRSLIKFQIYLFCRNLYLLPSHSIRLLYFWYQHSTLNAIFLSISLTRSSFQSCWCQSKSKERMKKLYEIFPQQPVYVCIQHNMLCHCDMYR
jgi:hypothetical protein